MVQLIIGYQLVVESTDCECENSMLCYILSLPPSLSCFLHPAWFVMVGGDRSFNLALTEKDVEFYDELREGWEVRGAGSGVGTQ